MRPTEHGIYDNDLAWSVDHPDIHPLQLDLEETLRFVVNEKAYFTVKLEDDGLRITMSTDHDGRMAILPEVSNTVRVKYIED